MARRWVCGVVMVALVLSSLGWSAPAMASQLSDYYWFLFPLSEFIGGEVGWLLGALLGMGAQIGVCYLLPVFDCDGKTTEVDMQIGAICVAVGAALGTGYGVVIVGQALGVTGNVSGAYVGSFLGIAVQSRVPALGLALLAIPSVLAVIGYNIIGAKMKDTRQSAPLPWALDLPVLSLEF